MLHVKPHELLAHVAVAFATLGHAAPQAPQLAALLVVSVHMLLQSISLPGQPETQLPFEHTGVPPEHA